MPTARDDDNLPTLICRPMQVWLGVIAFSYIVIYFCLPALLATPDTPIYKPNGQVFDSTKWYHIFGACILILSYILNVSQPRPRPMDTLRVFFIIVLSIILLSLAVFLTGGFTDSPFSGAVALYIGFFLALAKQPEFKWPNLVFIVTTILLLAAPYVHLWGQGYDELNILHWIDKPAVLWGRWAISIAILLVAAVVGERISSRLSNTKSFDLR